MSVVVKPEHCRKVKFCARGTRLFFKKHSLDYQKFLREGISEEELLATGDGMALKAIEVARNGGQ